MAFWEEGEARDRRRKIAELIDQCVGEFQIDPSVNAQHQLMLLQHRTNILLGAILLKLHGIDA